MKKTILGYYQEVMHIIDAATAEHGYGTGQAIVKMADETLSYNFRQELAHQIIKKEEKEKAKSTGK